MGGLRFTKELFCKKNRQSLRKTLGCWLSYIANGILAGLVGPTLVAMEILLDTDIKTLSLSVTISFVGFGVGSLSVIWLHRRIRKWRDVIYGSATMCMGVCVLLLGFQDQVWIFTMLLVINMSISGIITASSHSCAMDCWEDRKMKDTVFFILAEVYNVASGVSPLILQPFMDVEDTNDTMRLVNTTQTLFVNDTIVLTTETVRHAAADTLLENTTIDAAVSPTCCSPQQVGETGASNDDALKNGLEEKMWRGFLLLGILIFLCGAYRVAETLLCSGFSQVSSISEKDKDKTLKSKIDENAMDTHNSQDIAFLLTGKRKIVAVILGVSSVVVYFGMETGISDFSATYVVKEDLVGVSQSPYVTSTYWIAYSVAGALIIPLIRILKPSTMLFIALPMFFLCFLVLLLVSDEVSIVVWLSFGGLGVFTSPFFPCLAMWLDSYVASSGTITGLIYAGMAAGSIVTVFLIGHLMKTYGPENFVYVMLAACSILMTQITSGKILEKRCVHFPGVWPSDLTVNVPAPDSELKVRIEEQEHCTHM